MKQRLAYSLLLIMAAISFLSCDKKVSVSGPQEFETGVATYFISSTPQGAAIFVDNRNSGLFTPDTVKWLQEGEHNFVLKLEPYLDYPFDAVAEENIVNSKIYSFYSDSKNFGSIKFESEPNNCTVYLNDSLMSFKTPHTLGNLLPAMYKVKYEFPEHRADSSLVFVYAGKQSYINIQLPDTTVWVTYTTGNSTLPENTINGLVVDDNNTMWIGTWHNGIVKIDNGRESFITKDNSNLPNNIVNRIEKGKDGSIWAATYSGLAKITGEIITVFTSINSPLPSSYISDLDIDSQGNLWIGTQSGLAKYNGSDWIIYKTSNSTIPANFITCVLVDNNDVLWIGTNQFNIAEFDGISTWTTYQSDELLVGDSVADLIVGNDNKIWVGLVAQPTQGKPGGVFVLEQDSLVAVNFNLANKRINRFFMDDQQKLWIGSRSGVLSVTSPGNYKLYTANITGLPINDILSIAKDGYGNMWFGTNGGGLVKYKIWKE